MLREHGTWSLADVLAPAIGYARDGFPLVPRGCEAILAVRGLFLEHWPRRPMCGCPAANCRSPARCSASPRWPRPTAASCETAEREGSGAHRRDRRRDPHLVAGLRRARDRPLLPHGTAVRDSSGEAHAACCATTTWPSGAATEAPLTAEFGRYTVAKCGFWSQGPALLQQLGMLRHAGLEHHVPGSAGFVHRITEAAKLALADRLAWYGTASGARGDAQEALLSEAYLRERWATVGLQRASEVLRPGTPLGLAPRLPDLDVSARTLRTADTRFGIGEPTFAALPPVAEWAERELFVGDTCHIDVIDRHGNMVAATPSGGWLSSSPAIPALGFALNTRLQMSWLDEGLPGSVEPASRPAPRCRRRWRCATASPTWCSARPAATSRTSGRSASSCAMRCTA
jgi:gamma-glutamyltranspeptidase/glutathione hydrolase